MALPDIQELAELERIKINSTLREKAPLMMSQGVFLWAILRRVDVLLCPASYVL